MARSDLQVAGLNEGQEARLRAQRFRGIGETGRRLAFCDAPHVKQPSERPTAALPRKGRRLKLHTLLDFTIGERDE